MCLLVNIGCLFAASKYRVYAVGLGVNSTIFLYAQREMLALVLLISYDLANKCVCVCVFVFHVTVCVLQC